MSIYRKKLRVKPSWVDFITWQVPEIRSDLHEVVVSKKYKILSHFIIISYLLMHHSTCS